MPDDTDLASLGWPPGTPWITRHRVLLMVFGTMAAIGLAIALYREIST